MTRGPRTFSACRGSAMAEAAAPVTLRETLLAAAHRRLGARMVPFAGYVMPVQYPTGIIAEHVWTRTHAGLFDVSHMGPSFLRLKDPEKDVDANHALDRGHRRDAGLWRYRRIEPGPAPLHAADERSRGRRRRPDDRPARRPGVVGGALHHRQCRRQRGRLCPLRRRGRRSRPSCSGATIARSSPCRGRRPRRCSLHSFPASLTSLS